jgi:hypothetical protein
MTQTNSSLGLVYPSTLCVDRSKHEVAAPPAVFLSVQHLFHPYSQSLSQLPNHQFNYTASPIGESCFTPSSGRFPFDNWFVVGPCQRSYLQACLHFTQKAGGWLLDAITVGERSGFGLERISSPPAGVETGTTWVSDLKLSPSGSPHPPPLSSP